MPKDIPLSEVFVVLGASAALFAIATLTLLKRTWLLWLPAAAVALCARLV